MTSSEQVNKSRSAARNFSRMITRKESHISLLHIEVECVLLPLLRTKGHFKQQPFQTYKIVVIHSQEEVKVVSFH